MKQLLVLILGVIITICLHSENETKLIGEWKLTHRIVQDFDGNFEYDDYNSYVKLKTDFYKNNCEPKIMHYEESTTLLLNSDSTGYLEVKIKINNNNASINWQKKSWMKSKSSHYKKKLKWIIDKDFLIIDIGNKQFKYEFMINKTDDETLILKIKPNINFVSQAGIYLMTVNTKEGK